MMEREKLSANNFNDWFRQLKLVLRVEKKMFIIEQPLPAAPTADSEAQLEWSCIQTFHACKQEEGKPVGPYILKMKGYVEQLKRLSYVLMQDISVGLILNDLTSDFARFVRKYNMHSMGNTVGELHALLIEYEKGLPKKAATTQGLGGARKLKQRTLYLYVGNGVHAQVEAIGSYELVLPNGLLICLDNCHYAPTITIGVVSVSHLVDNGFTQCFTNYGISVSKNDVLYFNAISNNDMVRSMINLTTLPLSFWDYALETAARILNMVQTKKVDKTPYELWYGKVPNLSYLKETMGYYFYFPPENKNDVARYAEFLEKNLLSQEISGKAKELKEIQDKDTSPSENTSDIPMEVEGFEPPQEEVVPMRRVDYEETFSPVADIRAIRILIAIAALYDYEIWKMDIKTAFLNGYLDEDIYMVQPECFVHPNHSRKVCKFQRSIYGLKQASRSWNKRFDKEIKRFRFAQNLDELCVLIQINQ
ncbi:retrotransposon protein, putative, ty1-copia subclass [Tanacetum coccineum]